MSRKASHKLRLIPTRLAWLGTSLLLMVTAALPVHAQGSRIEGIVRDVSGASVPHAQVELRAKSYTATASSDLSGAFAFDNVPDTSGTIVVAAKGFQQVEQLWNVSGGAPVRVEITLKPLPVTEQVIVTAARTETRLNESPLSNMVLSRDDLLATPALTLDDRLRQVPGFSLFRRSSSRTANPSTLGVSLRGLGGTATSRVLVLEDGIPLNDPFGSWVYWDRVPAESVSRVEVAQEGASSLYGSSALSGVVQFLTRPAHPAGISLETSYGNQNTPDLSLWAGGEKGNWEAAFGGEVFQTDGYFLISGTDRGSVDRRASSRHGTADLMIGRKIGTQSQIFARGWYFDDARNNGTVAQTNDIRLGQGALGANLQLASLGSLQLRFYGSGETMHQIFSAVQTGRNTEFATDRQTVPAHQVGGSALWTRGLGKRHTLVAGFDGHEETGVTSDLLFSGSNGSHLRDTVSGGHQRTLGLFGEDMIRIAPRWLLSVSARYDHWRTFGAFTQCTAFLASCTAPLYPPYLAYSPRSYDAFSPRATLMQQLNSHVSWSVSVYRAFRGPTLNELYRSFRQGPNLTSNNPYLRAERLTGGEAGVNVVGLDRHLEVRGVFFFNEVINPVANVTLTPQPAGCPSGTTCRQKQNLGRTSAPGFAIDGVARFTNHWQLSAGYQYVNATIISFPANTALVGNWIVQVPHNVVTFQARYANPSRITLALTGRMVGKQYDDDQNLFRLGNFFVLDALASRRIGAGAEVFASVENLLNERYTTGFASTTPVLVPQRGLPVVARFGLRFQFPQQ